MFREFFRWWFGQLSELLPERWRGATSGGGDALLISPTGPHCDGTEAVVVSLRRNGRETPLGRFRAPPSAPRGDARLISPPGPHCGGTEAVVVSLRRNGRETPLGRFGLAASALGDIPRPSGKPAVLRVGESDVLGKTLSLPLAAERQLEQVLAFEMDRETPFKPDELFWTHRIDRRDRQTGQIGRAHV